MRLHFRRASSWAYVSHGRPVSSGKKPTFSGSAIAAPAGMPIAAAVSAIILMNFFIVPPLSNASGIHDVAGAVRLLRRGTPTQTGWRICQREFPVPGNQYSTIIVADTAAWKGIAVGRPAFRLTAKLHDGDAAENQRADQHRHGIHDAKTTSASAIQPRPAVMPSAQCGVSMRGR